MQGSPFQPCKLPRFNLRRQGQSADARKAFMKDVVKALAEAKRASDNYLTPIINSQGATKAKAQQEQDASMEEEAKQ